MENPPLVHFLSIGNWFGESHAVCFLMCDRPSVSQEPFSTQAAVWISAAPWSWNWILNCISGTGSHCENTTGPRTRPAGGWMKSQLQMSCLQVRPRLNLRYFSYLNCSSFRTAAIYIDEKAGPLLLFQWIRAAFCDVYILYLTLQYTTCTSLLSISGSLATSFSVCHQTSVTQTRPTL